MTSLSPIRTRQPSVDGRSVRDIVETSPELVNEVWCRKIFRQILQSLELQYAMQMPHRAITPDTIVFHENGEPLLVPASATHPAAGEPPGAAPAMDEPAHGEADDLHALAAIVHYAITREPVPAAPLRGRAPEGYSDSLVAAVDRCLAPDPAQRPQHIDELRDLLGIVSLGPPSSAQLAPARMSAHRAPPVPPLPGKPHGTAAPAQALPDGMLPSFMHGAAGGPGAAPGAGLGAGLSRWQRWAVAVGGGAILAALALTMFAELRDSGSYDHIVLTLPQTGEHPQDVGNGNGALLAGAPLQAQSPAGTGASDGGATAAGSLDGQSGPALPQTEAAATDMPQGEAPPGGEARAPLAASGRHAPAARAGAAPNGAPSYRLRIQPWGVVYVDGVDRGVSPPVKRLTLAPGRHTLRVTNPAFDDRVLEVDSGSGGGVVAVNFNDQAR